MAYAGAQNPCCRHAITPVLPARLPLGPDGHAHSREGSNFSQERLSVSHPRSIHCAVESLLLHYSGIENWAVSTAMFIYSKALGFSVSPRVWLHVPGGGIKNECGAEAHSARGRGLRRARPSGGAEILNRAPANESPLARPCDLKCENIAAN